MTRSYPSRRPTPPGAVGSWHDARRAPAYEVARAADRERLAWTPAVIRIGDGWLHGIVMAWRPLPAGRWAAHVLWGPPLTTAWVTYSPGTLRPGPVGRPGSRRGAPC
ncbi:hypothetical protein ACFVFS_34515 [Kitasatospora sp. NPDC057692]|uniref:hypothetical protein n=1 Tax=Kitasatospora sp. NPDC057692 TaxID=3346215 RepID=UPI0036A907E9